jgi:CDP-6-deoxy-D-xylo-4-hexulose-3-dehydrase
MTLHGSLEGRRKEVVDRLIELGVECRPIVAGNFLKNPVINLLDAIVCDAPNADYLDKNGFFIGNDSIPLEEKIIAVGELIDSIE